MTWPIQICWERVIALEKQTSKIYDGSFNMCWRNLVRLIKLIKLISCVHLLFCEIKMFMQWHDGIVHISNLMINLLVIVDHRDFKKFYYQHLIIQNLMKVTHYGPIKNVIKIIFSMDLLCPIKANGRCTMRRCSSM